MKLLIYNARLFSTHFTLFIISFNCQYFLICIIVYNHFEIANHCQKWPITVLIILIRDVSKIKLNFQIQSQTFQLKKIICKTNKLKHFLTFKSDTWQY